MSNNTANNLQKELEFYTNLLAQHEKSKRNKYLTSSLDSRNCLKKISAFPSHRLNSHKFNDSNFQANKEHLPKEKFVKKRLSASSPMRPAKRNKLFTSSGDHFSKQISSSNYQSRNENVISRNNLKLSNLQCSVNATKQSIQTSFKNETKNMSENSDSLKLMKDIATTTLKLKLRLETLNSVKSSSKASQIEGTKKGICKASNTILLNKPLNNSKKISKTVFPENKSFKRNFDAIKREKILSDKLDCSSGNRYVQPLLVKSKPSTNSNSVTVQKMHSDYMKKIEVLKKTLEQKSVGNKSTNNLVLKQLNNNSRAIPSDVMRPMKETFSNISTVSKNNLLSCSAKPIRNPLIETEKTSVSVNNSCSRSASVNLLNRNAVPKTPNALQSKYKFVNKVQIVKNPSKTPATKVIKKFKGSSSVKKRNFDTFKLINGTVYHSKISPIGFPKFKKVVAHTPHSTSRRTKMKSNKFQNALKHNLHSPSSKYHFRRSYKRISGSFSKHESLNLSKLDADIDPDLLLELATEKNQTENLSKLDADVDPDLLLELATENKLSLIKSKRVYKSKNRIVNKHSVQIRTAKMIKSKYFNPNKKPVEWMGNHTTKYFNNGYSRNFTSRQNQRKISGNGKHNLAITIFPNKFHRPKFCTDKRKIINVGGDKFVIGPSGKSLNKIKTTTFKRSSRMVYKKSSPKIVKNSTPVTKMIASRVLNRSINNVLSASVKKKVQKVNTYCMFYNRFGRCNKGVKCPYVHDPCKIAVCTRFLRGTCKNEKCLFSHEISPGKMAICSFFLQDICTKKDCPYRHEKLHPDAQLCKAFVQGYCPQGKECKKAHVLICPKYVQGACDKGKNCAFPHPILKKKKSVAAEPEITKTTDDELLESMNRYFHSDLQKDLVKGSVVPKRKTLSEQPSFLSLVVDDTS